ncbi:MAG: hypothetical protein KDA24_19950 [Deltaproteobacteria bacterium]|nr:hypothetical protein [Deltaproteobacteria bacterium]
MPRQPRFLLRVRALTLLMLASLFLLATPTTAEAGWSSGLRPLWVSLGGAGGGGISTDQGHGYASLTVGLRLIPIVPEVTIREGVSGRGSTLLHHHGNIALGARLLLPGLPFLRPNVRFAFSHRHDAPMDVFEAKPLAVIFGTASGITHRSGFETGAGIELSFGPKKIVGAYVQGTLVVLPPAQQDLVTGLVEAGVSFSIGPPRP